MRASPLREALAFLTPFPGARRPSPHALRWFPAVGAAIGAVLGGLWWGTARLWPQAVTAALVVTADLVLTGMLHFDGLTDSADGLLPSHLTTERRLSVMREPAVGAFGIAAAAVVLLSRWAVFATLRPNGWTVLLVVALWCASRTSMATVVGRLHYARPEHGEDAGLAGAFLGSPLPPWAVALVLGATVAVAAFWKFPAGSVAVLAGLVAFAAVVALGVRRLGGYTGDVLGAAGLVGETVGLVVAAAKW
jgi:adenosylcobinamide-GDP ribazoletransferase